MQAVVWSQMNKIRDDRLLGILQPSKIYYSVWDLIEESIQAWPYVAKQQQNFWQPCS